MKKTEALRAMLDTWVARYNNPEFIAFDPISVPHRFTRKQDIEIAGFFAATLAWGQRTTIINNSNRLMQLMDGAPHQFILHHTEKDLIPMQAFVHRTFNATDLLYFIHFLRKHYTSENSLETAFTKHLPPGSADVTRALSGFHTYFFDDEHAPQRTRKHIATPARKSACKRLNMYLRWMVRHDRYGVDFGLWKQIRPAQLICPVDVHAERIARQLGLITRKAIDWDCALELTANLRQLDPVDPVKYDFALFGMSASKKQTTL